MGFWSNVKSKIGNAVSSLTGESLDTGISSHFNPDGVGFQQNIAPQIDAAINELIPAQVDAMILRAEAKELQSLGNHSDDLGRQGDKLVQVADKMDEKGQKAFDALTAKYGSAIINDRSEAVGFENKVLSQLPDEVLALNGETRPAAKEAQFTDLQAFQERKTSVLNSVKSWGSRFIEGVEKTFDKIDSLVSRATEATENFVGSTLEATGEKIDKAGQAISNTYRETKEGAKELGAIGFALAVNTKDSVVIGAQKKMDELSTSLQNSINRVSDNIGKLADRAEAKIVDLAEKYDQGIQNAGNAIAQGAKNIGDGIKNVPANARVALHNGKENAVKSLEEKAQEFLDKAIKSERQVEVPTTSVLGLEEKRTESKMSFWGKLQEKAAYALNDVAGKLKDVGVSHAHEDKSGIIKLNLNTPDARTPQQVEAAGKGGRA